MCGGKIKGIINMHLVCLGLWCRATFTLLGVYEMSGGLPHQVGEQLDFVVAIPGIPQQLQQLQTEGTAVSYWRTLASTTHTACAASVLQSLVHEAPGKTPPVL
jgi:hypothetical protein